MTIFILGAIPAHAGICDFVLFNRNISSPIKLEKQRRAKDELERIVESVLLQLGFKITDDPVRSKWINFRIRRLAKKLDPYQLQNPRYRNFFIEKLIDLKVSENIGPINGSDVYWSEEKRRALNRLVLRVIINKGLSDFTSQTVNPNLLDRFVRAVRVIRHNKSFRLLVEWKMPLKTHLLTEEQISAIADHGAAAINEDPVLWSLVKSENKTVRIRQINELVMRVLSLYFASIYYDRFSPDIIDGYEYFHAHVLQDEIDSIIE